MQILTAVYCVIVVCAANRMSKPEVVIGKSSKISLILGKNIYKRSLHLIQQGERGHDYQSYFSPGTL